MKEQMAEIREKVAEVELAKHDLYNFFLEHTHLTLRGVDKLLSIPIPKPGEECPKCKGTGWGQFYFNCNAHCDDCKGSGKLPDETKTIEDLIKEYLGNG